MFYCSVFMIIVVSYILCDVNYFIRTVFTLFYDRVNQQKCALNDNTTIYGLCTFQDCDIWFRNIRVARLVRELDFARYHFYELTGIYQRSMDLNIKSLQGCTLTVEQKPIPIFVPYQIDTKLVYWDDRSLFFEHKVVTLHDNEIRCLLVSRQHAIGSSKTPIEALLQGLEGSTKSPECPIYIKYWLDSMLISSSKLREVNKKNEVKHDCVKLNSD